MSLDMVLSQRWVSLSDSPYCLRFAARNADAMVRSTAVILDHLENGSHKLVMADSCFQPWDHHTRPGLLTLEFLYKEEKHICIIGILGCLTDRGGQY